MLYTVSQGSLVGWSPSNPQCNLPVHGPSIGWLAPLPAGASWDHVPNQLLAFQSCAKVCFWGNLSEDMKRNGTPFEHLPWARNCAGLFTSSCLLILLG